MSGPLTFVPGDDPQPGRIVDERGTEIATLWLREGERAGPLLAAAPALLAALEAVLQWADDCDPHHADVGALEAICDAAIAQTRPTT